MAARARQFAEFMFSPESVAGATRAVYASLLSRATADGARPSGHWNPKTRRDSA